MERSVPSRPRIGPRSKRLRIAAEFLPVLLILASLAGTLALLLSVHRRRVPPRPEPPPVARPQVVAVAPIAPPTPTPPPSPPPQPAEPSEDPTPKELARIDALTALQVAASETGAREAEALERARARMKAEIERLDRRERTIRARAAALDERALTLEATAENLEIDRDFLDQKRTTEQAKLDRARARARVAYAIQPYRGPNGTWRRPIPIECVNGMLKLQPDGPTFSLMDLTPLAGLLGPRANPFLAAVAREAVRVQGGPTPDGAPAVPYILFVVRPDGIRPYYEALARLEPLGLAFGYELVDQEWEIAFPDPGDLSDWDRSAPPPERWPTDRPLTGRAGPGDRPPTFADLDPPAETGRYATDSEGKPVIFAGSPSGGLDAGYAPALGGGGSLGLLGARGGPPGAPPIPSTSGRATGGGEGHLGHAGSPDPSQGGRPQPGGPGQAFEMPPIPTGRGPQAGSGAMTDRLPGQIPAGSPEGSPGRSQAGQGMGSTAGRRGVPDPIPSIREERDLEMVVACESQGVIIHPGAYRLSTATLKARGGNLVQALRTILAARQLADPGIAWQPRIRFLIEPGGHRMYWTARGQVLVEGLRWPTSVQVAPGAPPRLFQQELH